MADEEKLLGLAEIALRFGVARNTAWRWTQRPDFPAPLARLASGPVWKHSDIEEWGTRLPLRVGRPQNDAPE